MPTLQEIRAKIAAQENKTQKGSSTQSDNSIYPHWNIDEGAIATVRFLPDGNPNNEWGFWVERQMIKLPFNGVVGEPNVKQVTVQVPCMETWGESCPILAEVRPWYKDESLKDLANKYWKKRSYIFQGFVRQNPLGEDKTPANPIRKFIISPQIFSIIRSSLLDPEMEELPTDYLRGIDFNIKKTSKGGYADYSTSNWARKESPLTEVEQAAIAANGLFNLSEFLPKKPNEAELRIIKEMFDASVDGEPFDNEKWGAYYRPYGLDAPNDAAKTTTAKVEGTKATATASTPSFEDDVTAAEAVVVPKTTSSTSAASDKAQDILQMIRARQARP